MSKRSSMLSRAFFRRPAIRALVPSLKLLLVVIAIGCESHAGVYTPAGLGEDTGLSAEALAGGLADLLRRGHVSTDPATGEIFITDFYRDNKFAGTARQRQWHDDFRAIESIALKNAVLTAVKNSPECGLEIDEKGNLLTNQDLGEQGKERKGKESQGKEAASSASPAGSVFEASSSENQNQSLNAWLDRLTAAAERLGGDQERDRRNIEILRSLAADHGVAAVISAAGAARLPAAAVKAVKKALTGSGKQGGAGCADSAERAADAAARLTIDPEAEAAGRALIEKISKSAGAACRA